MAKNMTDRFIGALTELEYTRDVEQMVALFTDDCEVGNVAVSEKFRGIEGVRRYWTDYRDNFKDVCVPFSRKNFIPTIRYGWNGRLKAGLKTGTK